MKAVIFLLMFLASAAQAQVSLLGGIAKYEKPLPGIYWNPGQSHDFEGTPPIWGLRYDGKWWAVQYTDFGTVKMNALAVWIDAPAQGGYDGNTDTCVGPCGPTNRWHMESATQSIALMAVKRIGNFSLEAGVNLYEIKTRGDVEEFVQGNHYNYKPGRYLDVGPMFGIGYKVGDFTVRYQWWRMEGKGQPGDHEIPPATFNGARGVQTLTIGWSF